MAFSEKFKELLHLFLGREGAGPKTPFSNLAYIGDSLLDLYIRLYLLETFPGEGVEELHRRSVKYSNPHKEKAFLDRIYADLLPEEKQVVDQARRRLRRMPSHIHLLDYPQALALESLLGYLFLEKQYLRMMEIMEWLLEGTKPLEKGS